MKKVHLIFMLLIGFGCISYAQTVTIGKQVWMTKNLDVSTFRNGDPIPEVKTDEEWEKASENKQPAWCYYDNDPANGRKNGKLYNWYAVNDPRGLCPKGWHIPSHDEWKKLTNFLGDNAGIKMKSKTGWKDNGTNESGFSGLPGGKREDSFYDGGKTGIWWSSTENTWSDCGTGCAWFRELIEENGHLLVFYAYKGDGFSVRCLRD